MTAPASSPTEDLETRYAKLLELKANLELELEAVRDGLRVAGVLPPRRGRPIIEDKLTEAQAREFHRRHLAGEDSEEVKAGEREYQRRHKRAARARAGR